MTFMIVKVTRETQAGVPGVQWDFDPVEGLEADDEATARLMAAVADEFDGFDQHFEAPGFGDWERCTVAFQAMTEADMLRAMGLDVPFEERMRIEGERERAEARGEGPVPF